MPDPERRSQVETTTRSDAALPFLSGAAGVMLLAGLLRLQHGALAETPINHTALNLAEGDPLPPGLRLPP